MSLAVLIEDTVRDLCNGAGEEYREVVRRKLWAVAREARRSREEQPAPPPAVDPRQLPLVPEVQS